MWSRDATACLLPQALIVAVAVAFVCCMPTSALDAGGAMSSCVSRLSPCGDYLNGTQTTPVPDSCCHPLKEAACVCSSLLNKAAPEQEVLLAKRCGVTTDASTCGKYAHADAAASGTTAASSASTGTPASTAQTTQQVDSSKMETCICPESDPPCSKDGCFCCYDGPGWPCFQTREQCRSAKACGCVKRPRVAINSSAYHLQSGN